VACAVPTKVSPQRGFAFRRRLVPPDLVVDRGGIRYTEPALTALDLVEFTGGDAIDDALRKGATTLPRLRAALDATRSRRGNAARWAMLLDSRDEPWSNGERRFHRMLRAAGITGWRPNFALLVAGSVYRLDVAFPALRLCIEVDGQVHRYDEATFEGDRWRQNALVLDGWRVIRFTMRMIEDHPEAVLATIRAALDG
jgi:very-short-patch-repair endonuclease